MKQVLEWALENRTFRLEKISLTSNKYFHETYVSVCSLDCIDLYNDTLNILGTNFSYNEKLIEEKKCYKTLTNIQLVLSRWKMRKFVMSSGIKDFWVEKHLFNLK